jgi:hypothetical protein
VGDVAWDACLLPHPTPSSLHTVRSQSVNYTVLWIVGPRIAPRRWITLPVCRKTNTYCVLTVSLVQRDRIAVTPWSAIGEVRCAVRALVC